VGRAGGGAKLCGAWEGAVWSAGFMEVLGRSSGIEEVPGRFVGVQEVRGRGNRSGASEHGAAPGDRRWRKGTGGWRRRH
jgi:hypothetical protein